jgi:hypothetical protein
MPSWPPCPECHRPDRSAGKILGPDNALLDTYVCITPGCRVQEYGQNEVRSRSPELDGEKA